MLSRLSTTLLARFVALAMVLTVAFHAGQPIERPLAPEQGSAFSAATVDVAIAPARAAHPERLVLAIEPSVLPLAALPLPPVLLAGGEIRFRPDPTGPPAYEPLERGPAPRAPPLA